MSAALVVLLCFLISHIWPDRGDRPLFDSGWSSFSLRFLRGRGEEGLIWKEGEIFVIPRSLARQELCSKLCPPPTLARLLSPHLARPGSCCVAEGICARKNTGEIKHCLPPALCCKKNTTRTDIEFACYSAQQVQYAPKGIPL